MDEATQQCRQVAIRLRDMHVPSVCVEINGIGRFLPNILRREINTASVACTVTEISSTRPKSVRILEGFDALLAARALYVHARVLKTPFITEMREWQPVGNKGHDDGLDAVAGALSRQPVRLRRDFGRRTERNVQFGTGGDYRAQTDFDI